MRSPTYRPRRRGITILEVCIAAFLLALLAVPTWTMLEGVGTSIKKTDQRRMSRFLVKQVMDRVESIDFMILYNEFNTPSSVLKAGNPLHIGPELKEEIERQGWTINLTFQFMTHDELGTDRANPMHAPKGILHLQAGHLTLVVERPGLPDLTVKRPIYCPLILGRPGMLVSQCPALNQALRQSLSHVP